MAGGAQRTYDAQGREAVDVDEFELSEGAGALTTHAATWDALAAARPNPFLSAAWLAPWVAHHAPRDVRVATLCDPSGALLAGAVLRNAPGGLASAQDPSTDWDAVAVDDDARRRLWENLARLGHLRFHLSGMYVGTRETAIATDAFAAAGYGVLPSVREAPSPYIALPGTVEEFMASRSRNRRQQLKKRRRDLEAAGQVRLLTTRGGADLERDLDEFLRVEAAGWKGRSGTAITSSPQFEGVYREFARAAADRGWLRLYLLELDGTVIAGQIAAVLGEEMFVLKTGFDEAWAGLSPGFVLTADVIGEAIGEGLAGVDFLGRADAWKTTWTDRERPRQRLRVLRGPAGRVAERGWTSLVHPRLVRLRDRAREDPELGRRLEWVQNLVQRPR